MLVKKTSGNEELKSSFGFARQGNKKLWETLAPTTQDRLQYNVSLEAFLWLVQN
jgi:hypothetical protein